MTTEDRRVGKLLPSPVVPQTTVCFKIVVPNAVQYRAALLGQLSILGDWHTWDHPTDGTECIDCETAAQLWRNALYNAVWSEECEEPVNCEDVADCIDTNEPTQLAIANQIDTNEAIQKAIADQIANNNMITNNVYNTTVVGSPMLSSQRNAGVSKTTACEPNALFGSITAIVKQLHQNNNDFLEVFQLTDNAQQRLSKIVKAIPLLNEVPIDEALDFASQMATEIKENYEAQWTTSLEDEYRCALFCLVKEREGCELTFQDMVEYFNNRLGTSLEPINFFKAVVQYFISGTWTGTTVVDIMMLIQLSAWQEASEWTGITLRSLQTVGALGANDPDPDWALLCEDCGERQMMVYNFLPSTAGWQDGVFGSTWSLNNGWHYNSSNNISIYIASVPFDVYQVDVELVNYDASTFYATSHTGYAPQTGRPNMSAGTTRSVSFAFAYRFLQGTRLGVTGDGPYATTQYVRKITIWGPAL